MNSCRFWFTVLLTFMLANGAATVSSIAKDPEIQNKQASSKASYLALIAQAAGKTYFPLPEFAACKSSVCFQLDCQGTVSGIKVEEHPYDRKTHVTAPLADSALVYAVKNLHLPAPPRDLGCPATIRLIFDGRGGHGTKFLPQVIEPGALSEKSRKATGRSAHRTTP